MCKYVLYVRLHVFKAGFLLFRDPVRPLRPTLWLLLSHFVTATIGQKSDERENRLGPVCAMRMNGSHSMYKK